MAGPAGTGAGARSTGDTSWHPTVANLVALVVLELGAYAALRYFFRHAHGG